MKKFLIILAACGFFALAAPALAADGTISGTITHASGGTPVASMWVSFLNTSTRETSYVYGTEADGTYSKTVAPGTYDVSSYATTTAEPNIIFITKTISVTVASGETKSGQNFAVTRRGRFTGHVYSSDGVTPLSGAVVSATNTNGSGSGASAGTTTTDGVYYVSPAPSGNSTLSATGTYNFYATKSGYYGASVSGTALAADETTVTQDLRLTPGSTVTGSVLDASSAAIAGAAVTLIKSGSCHPT